MEQNFITKLPSAYQMYLKKDDIKPLKKLRTVLRYYISRLICQSNSNQFLTFLQENPIWQPLFQQKLHNFHSLLFKFADNRFSAFLRRKTLETTFLQMQNKLGSEKCQQLLEQKQILLSQLDEDFSLYLQQYDLDPFEGFFSLSLRNQKNQRLYDIVFVFLNSEEMLATCIQGPSGEHAQEWVKKLTKQLHGIRPMYLLLNALRLVCQQFHCQLLGIPSNHQVKKRWYGHQRTFFDYDEFWRDNGANLQHYWQIPLIASKKSLDEIPSKKRSMYRKRYEMLNDLANSIQQIL